MDDQDRELGRETVRPARVDPRVAAARRAEQREALEARGLTKNAPVIDDEPVPEVPQPPPAVAAAPDEGPGLTERRVAEAVAAMEPDAQAEDEVVELLKAKAGKPFRDVIEQLERGALSKIGQLRRHGRRLENLTEAAEILIAELQPGHQDALRQVCQDHDMPAWVILLGAVARLADLQELNAGDFESDWLNKTEERGRTRADTVPVCQMCQTTIPNGRRGQQFCCNSHGSGKVEHTVGCPCEMVKFLRGGWVRT